MRWEDTRYQEPVRFGVGAVLVLKPKSSAIIKSLRKRGSTARTFEGDFKRKARLEPIG